MYSIARPCAPLPRALLSDAPLPLLVTLGVLTAGAGILAATEIVPIALARVLLEPVEQQSSQRARLWSTQSSTLDV